MGRRTGGRDVQEGATTQKASRSNSSFSCRHVETLASFSSFFETSEAGSAVGSKQMKRIPLPASLPRIGEICCSKRCVWIRRDRNATAKTSVLILLGPKHRVRICRSRVAAWKRWHSFLPFSKRARRAAQLGRIRWQKSDANKWQNVPSWIFPLGSPNVKTKASRERTRSSGRWLRESGWKVPIRE